MIPYHVSGSPTIHQPSFLVVGNRTCKSEDKNDMLLLLLSYIVFLWPLTLRFFICFGCRCMVSTFSFPTKTIFSIVSWLVAIVANDLWHIRLHLVFEVSLSFVLPKELLSFSFLHVCSESKVLFFKGTNFGLDSTLFQQTIVPKSLKAWLDFMALYYNQVCYPSIGKPIKHCFYKIIIVNTYTNCKHLIFKVGGIHKERVHKLILLHLQRMELTLQESLLIGSLGFIQLDKSVKTFLIVFKGVIIRMICSFMES